MMYTREMYISEFNDAPYSKLIKERDRLIRSIRRFEKNEKAGKRDGFEWMCCPMPNVRYQCELQYLEAICELMREKYREQDGDVFKEIGPEFLRK